MLKQSYSFAVDSKLCIIMWSKSLAELTGRPDSSAIGKKYFEMLPGIFDNGKDAVFTAMETERTIVLKGHCFNCLHGQINADIAIQPFPGVRNGPAGAKVFIESLTSCMFSVRLKSLQRLIDIGKAASTLAHGVRNPLNAIKGAIVYLRQKYDNEPTLLEFTKIMEEEILRLDTFISRFLSASIPDMEQSAMEKKSDINMLVKKIEVYTSLQTNANNVRTKYEYGEVPSTAIKAFQFEQAVLSVINNAIEAMHHGGQLTVRTGCKERFGALCATVEITDTGPGMSEVNDKELSYALGEGGRGFGLFIAREIMQYYRGHLEITSKKGSGTSVTLYLPALREGQL